MQNRTLYFGDNLEILREKFPDRPDGDGYFDLIYLDPPYYKQAKKVEIEQKNQRKLGI